MNPPAPSPRPALRKAEDGTVHPASAHLSSLAVDVTPARRTGAKDASSGRAGKGKSKKGKAGKDAAEETVTLSVPLSKAERKRLRRRAESYGWSAEEAASHVLRVWADG